MEVTKEFTFDSSHRLHNSCKPKTWNKRMFGKCNNEPSHGHTYKLLVTVEGPIDTETGFIVNFSELKEIVRDEVVDRLDHHFLNDLVLFGHGELIPSCENTLKVIQLLLRVAFMKRKTSYKLKRLTLYETPTSYATLE